MQQWVCCKLRVGVLCIASYTCLLLVIVVFVANCTRICVYVIYFERFCMLRCPLYIAMPLSVMLQLIYRGSY